MAGNGVSRLKAAGIEVIQGVLRKECREHHRRFLTVQEKGRPYIILKWAQTKDGYLSPEKSARAQHPQPVWITGSLSRQLVHKWRTEEMAILVGTQTAIEDNPSLTAREWFGKNPHRLVIDRNLRIPRALNLLDDSVPTTVFHQQSENPASGKNLRYEAVQAGQDIPEQICAWGQVHGISSILVEGGARTLRLFIGKGLWDEARIFQGNTEFKEGVKAHEIQGRLITETVLEQDRLQILRND